MTPSSYAKVFETERLLVRTATVEDVNLFYTLWTSPQVMVNVGFPQGLPITRDHITDRLSGQTEGAFENLLAVELKATDQAIGECHLHLPNDEGIVEPDVKLLPAFWGRGYGSELWRQLVAYAFTYTDCKAVQGTPNVDNVASIRMQQSDGAVCVGEGLHQFPDAMSSYTRPIRYYVYQVRRADWQRERMAQQEKEPQSV